MTVRFSLRLPPEDYQQLRTGYLVQSLSLYKDVVDFDDMVFFDELGFQLAGTFASAPSSCDPPRYLHVPPLSPEWIDNMPCLHWPLKDRLFYWSFDRSGRMEIAEQDWEKYDIPNLKVVTYVGSIWYKEDCGSVQEYLQHNKYDLGGQQFANGHGYPILIKGDPHMGHIQAKSEESDED
ncbi:hypothetical protein E1B28_002742 [Marasmius oreades]|uniref:Uncharacterized protein n=1 Tax=Marasmius oreades TaxID=181124 RepID=A0A9P7UNE0_9AGAR|nr:uncharacterized protein E1B28_002742 [Marasmius oreades]KAG7086821.1 hypothetical protein E1B28_002742 [Marasmius oreades]